MGTNPLGSSGYANVGAALAGKADIASIQTDALIYAADTGAANAYAVSLSPTPPNYAAGQMVVFKAAHANTGASTLAVNGQAAQALVQGGGNALGASDIVAGQIVAAIYDGTQFQMIPAMLPSNTATPAGIQTEAYTFAADTGAANAYAVTLSPSPPAYAAGQLVVFQAANANTGASTLAVNGQSSQALVSNGGTAFVGGEITAGQIVSAVYDGTQFQLVGAVGAGGELALPNTISEYRLTLVSGTPVAPDQSFSGSATSIYLTPYTGDRIALYDGSSWAIYTPGEVSVDISSVDPSGVYDIFLQLVSSVPTLVLGPEWTDANDRDTDLAIQDGVYVLSGDPTQRWVGTFAMDGGTCYDDQWERFLFNAQNRLPRQLLQVADTYSTSSNSWMSTISANVVIGVIAESVLAWGSALAAGDGVSTLCELTTNFYDMSAVSAVLGTIGTSSVTAPFDALPTQVGVISPTLFMQSSVGGTTVNFLDDGVGTWLTYITVTVWV
jgi:hypothetical protein